MDFTLNGEQETINVIEEERKPNKQLMSSAMR